VFAPLGERWSLSIIQWWGGWAESESMHNLLWISGSNLSDTNIQVDTLIRYLLDELTWYEMSHHDALCPI
ncbi:hypothetical protein BDN67DRAFT_864790, partial [Paxillus ammoniavirescens]